MRFYPFTPRHMRLFALVLFVALAVSGCKEKKPYAAYSCRDITIKVHHLLPRGVDHKAVYLCAGNAITWVPGPNVKSFQVVFDPPDLPFGANYTTFGTGGKTSTPPLADPGELTVFKYDLTVTDSNNITRKFDPHVVGGGGL